MIVHEKWDKKCTSLLTYFFLWFQLAADANNMVAMTEDEKKRLEEILSDMGDLMDEVWQHIVKSILDNLCKKICCRLLTALKRHQVCWCKFFF